MLISSATQDEQAIDLDPYLHLSRYNTVLRAEGEPGGVVFGLRARILRVSRITKPAFGGFKLCLLDGDGEEQIETLPIKNPILIEAARKFLRHGHQIMAWGTLAEMQPGDPGYAAGIHFRVHDLRECNRETSMLAPIHPEIAAVDRLIKDCHEVPGGLATYLIDRLRSQCGVAVENLSARFKLAEEIVLLQALSHAQIPHSLNARLSVFLFSKPGTGKSLLGDYAKLLAPVSDRVQPTMVTPVGLSATCRLGPKGWTSDPGLLARCSGGLCVIDDLHRLETSKLNAFQGLFMSVSEEGRLRPVKAASATYDAKVALFFTANRMSVRDGKVLLSSDTIGDRAAEIALPYDLFSRVDLVVQLGAEDDAIRSAMKIASQPSCAPFDPEDSETRATPMEPSPRELEARQLQLIIARIKELIPIVDTAPIEKEIEETTLKLGLVLREYGAQLDVCDEDNFDGDGLVRRMALTLRKLVGALARLDGRAYATSADLDRAWELLTPKLEVARWLSSKETQMRPIGTRAQVVQDMLRCSELRWAKIVLHYNDQKVTVAQVAQGLGYSEVTVRREFGRRGLVAAGGFYEIPAAQDYQQGSMEESAVSEEMVRPVAEDDGLLTAAPGVVPRRGFDDCLPAPPRSLDPVLEHVGGLQKWSGLAMSMILYALAKGLTEARGMVGGLCSYIEQETEAPLGMELRGRMREYLLEPSWEERARRVLGLLGAMELIAPPRRIDGSIELHERLHGPPPEGVKRALFDLRARMVVFLEEADRELMVQVAKDEKRREKERARGGILQELMTPA